MQCVVLIGLRFGRPSSTGMRLSGLFMMKLQALSLFMMRIATGRKHQIRVHAAHIGAAVVCDGRYSALETFLVDSRWCPRNFLHRSHLCFAVANRKVDVEHELPKDLAMALRVCMRQRERTKMQVCQLSAACALALFARTRRPCQLTELSRPYDKAAEASTCLDGSPACSKRPFHATCGGNIPTN